MKQRSVCTLAGLVVVTLLALAVDISATVGRGLPLWHPAILHLGLDLGGGTRVLLRASPPPGQTEDARAMDKTRRIIIHRLDDALDVSEPVIQPLTRHDRRFLSVLLPGVRTHVPAAILDLLQRTGRLTLLALHRPPPPRGTPARGYHVLARDTDLLPDSVVIGLGAQSGPVVDAAVPDTLARRIAAYIATSRIPFIGVAIDNRIYDVRPSTHVFVGGQFQITRVDPFTTSHVISAVAGLASTLRYGALPVPLKVVRVQEIGPTLGMGTVRGLIVAGVTSLCIVVLVLVCVYRLPGLLASAVLVSTLVIAGAVVTLSAVTLTLASLAGLTLAGSLVAPATLRIVRCVYHVAEESLTVRSPVGPDAVQAWITLGQPAAAIALTGIIAWWIGTTLSVSILVRFAMGLLLGVTAATVATALVISGVDVVSHRPTRTAQQL